MTSEFSWPHVTRIPVRFRDLDAFGHVNNAVVATYLEQARTECYLAMLSRENPCDPEVGLDFVVARAEIDYLAPIHHGDQVLVEVRPESLGRTSFSLAYEARGRRGPVARGRTVLVAYDHRAAAARPVPDGLRAVLTAGLPEQP